MADRRKVVAPVVLAGIGIGLLVALKRYKVIPRIQDYFTNPLRHKKVQIVTNIEELQKVVIRLREDIDKYRVLGFDCEWVTVNGTRRPVALLQLASNSGLCALIRLCHLKHVPGEIQQLLEDETVLKVGVSPQDDAKNLLTDYNISMKGTLDLRHLALYLNRQPQGLSKLSKEFIGVELNKSWRIRCSSWDSATLTSAQIDYAAKDAMVAIEIFKKMFEIYGTRTGEIGLGSFMEVAHGYHDRPFKYKGPSGIPGETGKKNRSINLDTQRRNLATRTKPLYHNCYMEAPDGELLCTMDRNKADWYRKKGLATIVCEEPLRMRLCFEPSGRAEGQTGAYDLVEKINQCTVCGTKEHLSRKFIVPKEYRKIFPVVMKSHSSHDILLLCLNCHRTSSMQDDQLREKLAILCKAPLVRHLKKLKSYAQALLKSHNALPVTREMMTEYIQSFYPDQELTKTFLQELTKIDTKSKSGENTGHAEKVTEYFKNTADAGGLLELEKMWREHFLATMQPQFLPEHWSTSHNAIRLELAMDRGRIDREDLILAGVNPSLLTVSEV